eukprot:TRINITY_DN11999_c0_g2_i1.p1 TRINITY_DN11999_c0_g2~~TRINITY_DN11999_c0_g2_i1.p1  ORF type:complete len:485 (+),score=42.19 TRINITY_DN11999_c0_g2_i1:100-1554(+)
MKYYDYGTWGLGFIWTLDGSVFQKSFACAFPCAMLAVGLHTWFGFTSVPSLMADLDSTTTSIMAGYTAVLGFLIVFRSQQAYSRWWEAGTLLQQLRGQWFIAYSSVIAFCSDDERTKNQVKIFHGEFVRLMSLLFALSLQRVTTMAELEFDVIDLSSLEHEALEHLRQSGNKVEIVFQWIQRLVVKNTRNGVLDVAPPILSRVFQELSLGFVVLQDVEKITEFPFPFPCCQLLSVLIIFQGIITPLVCAASVKSPVWAGVATFTLMFAYCGVNYIAAEIEMPCGDDRNDLPLKEMQSDLNASLESLLHPTVLAPPVFHQTAEEAVCSLRLSQTRSLDCVLFEEVFNIHNDVVRMRSSISSGAKSAQAKVTKKGVPRLCNAAIRRKSSLESIDMTAERRSSWHTAQQKEATELYEVREPADSGKIVCLELRSVPCQDCDVSESSEEDISHRKVSQSNLQGTARYIVPSEKRVIVSSALCGDLTNG